MIDVDNDTRRVDLWLTKHCISEQISHVIFRVSHEKHLVCDESSSFVKVTQLENFVTQQVLQQVKSIELIPSFAQKELICQQIINPSICPMYLPLVLGLYQPCMVWLWPEWRSRWRFASNVSICWTGWLAVFPESAVIWRGFPMSGWHVRTAEATSSLSRTPEINTFSVTEGKTHIYRVQVPLPVDVELEGLNLLAQNGFSLSRKQSRKKHWSPSYP